MLASFIANASTQLSSSPAFQAAFVGALTGAIVTGGFGLLRDFVAPAITRRSEKRKTETEIFRKYAEPLASSASKLFWRLEETLGGDGRGAYLKALDPRTDFEVYKQRSTFYRLAAVLGCIRALKRELSFFRFDQKRIDHVEDALDKFTKSLADGHEVEIKRLHGLLSLWNLPELSDKSLELRVAVDTARHLKSWLASVPAKTASELPPIKQLKLCSDLAAIISEETGLSVPQAVLVETQARSIRQIDIREAWLFRDWQTALGDLMIRRTDTGTRSFEVIGFGDFEDMVLQPTPLQSRYLGRLASLFVDVDVENADPFDARPIVMRKLLIATASLLKAIAETRQSKHLISKSEYQAVAKTLRRDLAS